MQTYKNPNLIEMLRTTMEKVERTSGVEPDDPALVELKNILSRRVAALEHRPAKDHSTGTAGAAIHNREVPESSLLS